MNKKLDAIIFGASGFTGQFVVQDAIDVFKDCTWGIAGRNTSKLQDVLKNVGLRVGKDLSQVPIILADVKDDKSLQEMAKRCKIVLNCCGPYRFYGEPVVKACIEAGTHHVDVSAEPQYVDKMQLKYHKMAQEKGSYVVSTCGFDSIPAEMGVVFTQRNFPGVINSIEMFWENSIEHKDSDSKALFHFGTWESVVHTLAHFREFFSLQRQLKNNDLPTLTPTLRMQLMQRPAFSSNYFVPIHAADRDTVLRSESLRYGLEQKHPIQFENYVGFSSLKSVILLPIILLVTAILSQCRWGRKLLLRNPSFFTRGVITHQGPSSETMKAHKFTMTFSAKGWSAAQALTEPPRQTLLTRVSGTDPFYRFAGLALLLTAKTILKESDKIPGSGGVLTPGAAFAHTSLIEELGRHEQGLKFEVLQQE